MRGSAETVKRVAGSMNRTPAQVALAWTLLNGAVTAPIIGARTLQQFNDNLGALDVRFSPEQRAELEQVSRIELGFPHDFLKQAMIQTVLFGNLKIASRSYR